MKVKDLMSKNPACASPDTSLEKVARMMLDHDCGSIPVLDASERPIGVVTDRDITCRTVAVGRNPLDMIANDIMSSTPVTVTAQMDATECFKLMEQHQIRRILVVDDQGACCGIVAQADVATNASKQKTAEVVSEISQPTNGESREIGS